MPSALSVDNDSARRPGRGQRLAGGDDKHSQPKMRSSRTDGRFACGAIPCPCDAQRRPERHDG